MILLVIPRFLAADSIYYIVKMQLLGGILFLMKIISWNVNGLRAIHKKGNWEETEGDKEVKVKIIFTPNLENIMLPEEFTYNPYSSVPNGFVE